MRLSPIPQTQIKMSHTLFKTYDFLMKKAISSRIKYSALYSMCKINRLSL
ncbi:hypothetical protein XBJ1_1909 [Xenorhabdus bovienii SS-2004]|uniref:Uncharacterized protein n=1 Tax=Xenorhabdus bovienii (strain SS-2004) TaxID=406818 RepID=D3V2S0_XENBS|nr:hypothetical protein XBJ1_1909 [Xenorhabdus bovienii SS-2004]